jgi:hypothetical protein
MRSPRWREDSLRSVFLYHLFRKLLLHHSPPLLCILSTISSVQYLRFLFPSSMHSFLFLFLFFHRHHQKGQDVSWSLYRCMDRYRRNSRHPPARLVCSALHSCAWGIQNISLASAAAGLFRLEGNKRQPRPGSANRLEKTRAGVRRQRRQHPQTGFVAISRHTCFKEVGS